MWPLDHKISHKGQFFIRKSGIHEDEKNIDKITLKVVPMKLVAMHITNQKLSFDIFIVRYLLNIFMEHDL